jgi:hypothetical protein
MDRLVYKPFFEMLSDPQSEVVAFPIISKARGNKDKIYANRPFQLQIFE